MTVTTITPSPTSGDDDRANRRLAGELRSARLFAAVDGRFAEADLMRQAAEYIEAPRYSLVGDVDELLALALDLSRPLEMVILIDRYRETFTAYPDHAAEQVTVVRTPSLTEAAENAGRVWPLPLAVNPADLEQSRFPMRVLHTAPAWLPPAASDALAA